MNDDDDDDDEDVGRVRGCYGIISFIIRIVQESLRERPDGYYSLYFTTSSPSPIPTQF
jgi:hypothetical protein